VRKDLNPTKMGAALERPSASCKRHSHSCEERTLENGIMLKSTSFYPGIADRFACGGRARCKAWTREDIGEKEGRNVPRAYTRSGALRDNA
jgi:hypothetical protein